MKIKLKTAEGLVDPIVEIVDGVMIVSPKEEKFEPKDGDVVTDCDGSLFIYKESLNGSNVYVIVKDNIVVFKPICTYSFHRFATEEEKQKLFDKLKVEGYEWDAEKKELVKLKWEPKVGDTYFRPNLNDCRFLCYEGRGRFDTMRYIKDCIEKGWVFKTKEECQALCDKLNEAINSVKP